MPIFSLDSGDLRIVLTELQDINKEWKHLGLELGLTNPVLDEIEYNFPRDVKRCLLEAIDRWLKTGSSELSWRKLCEALRSALVENPTLAEEIESRLSKTYN